MGRLGGGEGGGGHHCLSLPRTKGLKGRQRLPAAGLPPGGWAMPVGSVVHRYDDEHFNDNEAVSSAVVVAAAAAAATAAAARTASPTAWSIPRE